MESSLSHRVRSWKVRGEGGEGKEGEGGEEGRGRGEERREGRGGGDGGRKGVLPTIVRLSHTHHTTPPHIAHIARRHTHLWLLLAPPTAHYKLT